MAYALKKLLPNIIVVGVDPIGSILSENDKLVNPEAIADEVKDKPYAVEGIGYDFIPQVRACVHSACTLLCVHSACTLRALCVHFACVRACILGAFCCLLYTSPSPRDRG